MNKFYYSPPLDLGCLTYVDARLGKNRSSSSSSPCCGKPKGVLGQTDAPRMWGRHQVSDRCRGLARATEPGEVFPPGREGCLYLLLSEMAYQAPLGFGQPAAVFRSAFALSLTSFEDFMAGHFIHFNECSGSFWTWGCVCRPWTVIMFSIAETEWNTKSHTLSPGLFQMTYPSFRAITSRRPRRERL